MTTSEGAIAPADFIKQLFGPVTEHSVFITSLPNEQGAEQPRQVVGRDPRDIAAFVRKWDRPGRGMFFCVGTLVPGQTRRARENISEIIGLHVDIDFKSLREPDPDRALAVLDGLRLAPSLVVSSGNGLHAYWLFREALSVDQQEAVEAALRQLVDLLGGDPAPAHTAALMRLPGSHNTKGGEFKPVEVVRDRAAARYELEELEEWLAETSPVLCRLASAEAQAVAENPFLAAAARFGFKPPIDVEQRLAAMSYQGAGDAAIHSTQLSVSASLLRAGTDLEEVVSVLLEATRAAAGDFGERWNWKREEKAIRGMCSAWLRKNPPESPKPGARAASESPKPGAGATVHDLKAERAARAKPKPSAKSDDVPAHVILGSAVIEVMRAAGNDLMFTPDGLYTFGAGLWTMRADAREWLDVQVEIACRGIDMDSKTKLISDARMWIARNPDLRHENVAWDSHGKIPCLNGLLDPDTLAFEPTRPDHYATWCVPAPYDPAAKCDLWEQMIADAFGDREPSIAVEHIAVVQECFGTGLTDRKSRALSKVLILQGGANSGKSELLKVAAALYGGNPITSPLDGLEGTHGTMGFLRRAPWVLHEAFDQRKWLFSSVVKAIVTGEPININVKNGPMISRSIVAPVFWGTNHPPQFKEATKAIVSRMIILEMRQEFSDEDATGIARQARRMGFASPSGLVLDRELPGLLNWAITGLRRARARGFIARPDEANESSDAIRRDSNLVSGFLEDCVEFDVERMISVPDFSAAFSVWWLEEKGEDRRMPSNDSIGKALAALGDERIAHHPKEVRDNKRRYYAGIKLNENGLRFWGVAKTSITFEGKRSSVSGEASEVNSSVPDTWYDRPSIRRMVRKYQLSRQKQVSPSVTDAGVTHGELSPPHVTTQVLEQSKKPRF